MATLYSHLLVVLSALQSAAEASAWPAARPDAIPAKDLRVDHPLVGLLRHLLSSLLSIHFLRRESNQFEI